MVCHEDFELLSKFENLHYNELSIPYLKSETLSTDMALPVENGTPDLMHGLQSKCRCKTHPLFSIYKGKKSLSLVTHRLCFIHKIKITYVYIYVYIYVKANVCKCIYKVYMKQMHFLFSCPI